MRCRFYSAAGCCLSLDSFLARENLEISGAFSHDRQHIDRHWNGDRRNLLTFSATCPASAIYPTFPSWSHRLLSVSLARHLRLSKAIGVVIVSLENNMKTPDAFHRCRVCSKHWHGSAWYLLYSTVGFFGYWRYWESKRKPRSL